MIFQQDCSFVISNETTNEREELFHSILMKVIKKIKEKLKYQLQAMDSLMKATSFILCNCSYSTKTIGYDADIIHISTAAKP